MERPTRSAGEREPLQARPAEHGGISGADLGAAADSGALDSAAAERRLIERAQSGEEAAFAELVRLHQQRAYRIARQMVPSDDDARDLVQDAFLRVFKSLDRFDFQFSFATWLYRIVTNLAIDLLRKRRLASTTSVDGDEHDGELELVDADQVAPDERLASAEVAERVRACIASLAPHFRTVLALRELEGLPCNEIAKIVGATHVTVRWRLHRGRKLFQEEWERRERARASGADRSASGEAREAANNRAERSVRSPDAGPPAPPSTRPPSTRR